MPRPIRFLVPGTILVLAAASGCKLDVATIAKTVAAKVTAKPSTSASAQAASSSSPSASQPSPEAKTGSPSPSPKPSPSPTSTHAPTPTKAEIDAARAWPYTKVGQVYTWSIDEQGPKPAKYTARAELTNVSDGYAAFDVTRSEAGKPDVVTQFTDDTTYLVPPKTVLELLFTTYSPGRAAAFGFGTATATKAHVTVGAGSFDAVQLTYSVNVNEEPGSSTVMAKADWIVKGVGLVKSEIHQHWQLSATEGLSLFPDDAPNYSASLDSYK